MVYFSRLYKSFTLVFALALVLSVITVGCGNSDRDKGSDPVAKTTLDVMVGIDPTLSKGFDVPNNVDTYLLVFTDSDGKVLPSDKRRFWFTEEPTSTSGRTTYAWRVDDENPNILHFDVPITDEDCAIFKQIFIEMDEGVDNVTVGVVSDGDLQLAVGKANVIDFTLPDAPGFVDSSSVHFVETFVGEPALKDNKATIENGDTLKITLNSAYEDPNGYKFYIVFPDKAFTEKYKLEPTEEGIFDVDGNVLTAKKTTPGTEVRVLNTDGVEEYRFTVVVE